jgi:hypothetical protein
MKRPAAAAKGRKRSRRGEEKGASIAEDDAAGFFLLDDDEKQRGQHHSDQEEADEEAQETAEQKRIRLGGLCGCQAQLAWPAHMITRVAHPLWRHQAGSSSRWRRLQTEPEPPPSRCFMPSCTHNTTHTHTLQLEPTWTTSRQQHAAAGQATTTTTTQQQAMRSSRSGCGWRRSM